MKKIYFSIMMLVSLMTVSCDMDKTEWGALDEQTAIRNIDDLKRFRTSMYVDLRAMTNGGWILYGDLQMDEFHGLISNDNRNGIISNGLLSSSDGTVEAMWGSGYAIISSANLLIEKANDVRNSSVLTAAEKVTVGRYEAEAKFTRAYAYWWLTDHYCQPYSASIADTPHLGLPLTTKYNPTYEVSTYPDRSTLKETYALIEQDLEDALNGLVEYEKTDDSAVEADASELSSYTVRLMQSRIALFKNDYATALAKAREVILSRVYTLSSLSDYTYMWSDDISTETLFRPFQSPTELGSSVASAYINDETYTGADYIPTFETLNMYDAGDNRAVVFFRKGAFMVEGQSYSGYYFNKYPGNAALRTGTVNNFRNMTKPFRLSEAYLNAAEAAVESGNESQANSYLKALRAVRIENYKHTDLSGVALRNAVRLERKREFLGEGKRFSDLRRWHLGFERYAQHRESSKLNNVIVKAGQNLIYNVDDYRYTWPIPKAELDANPNLSGQQNPGY